MKKKRNIQKEVSAAIKKYTRLLGLERYVIHTGSVTEKSTSVAECVFVYPYLKARINYSEKSMLDMAETEVENCILHEMCHLITDPFYAKACSRYVTKDCLEDEREMLTDHIANIVFDLVNRK